VVARCACGRWESLWSLVVRVVAVHLNELTLDKEVAVHLNWLGGPFETLSGSGCKSNSFYLEPCVIPLCL
jgi:hypothetical protein